jgi:acyl dehydratase
LSPLSRLSDVNNLTTSGLNTDLAELPNLIGARLGPTEWVETTQEQVDCFADLTGDHNFLHVDVVAECLVRFYA